MNFLGHLYFSFDNPQLKHANLHGDFFKGSDYSGLPPKMKHGIVLHREIDHYIDHHPKVLELLHSLYPELPKIAGIAVDLFFDHLLAMHWQRYHSDSLRDFTRKFYASTPDNLNFYAPAYLHLLEKIKQGDWLFAYHSFEGLTQACSGLSHRITFANKLIQAPAVFLAHEKSITHCFEEFMADARKHLPDFALKNGILSA